LQIDEWNQSIEHSIESPIIESIINHQSAIINSVFILDSLLIGGLRFVLDKVVAAAEAEMNDDTALRDQLLEAQMRLELGEITDEQFAEIERNVLAAIREIKRPQQGALTMSPKDKITGVDIETFHDADRQS
jgi:hypothetical protein